VVASSLFFAGTFGVLAQTNVPTGTTRTKKQPVDITCAKNAVTVRDTALGAAFDTYASTLKTALTTRTAALLAGWDMTDKTARQAALKAAWSAYKNSTVKARGATVTARKAAWTTFKNSMKSCGGTVSNVDTTDSAVDTGI